jgi:Protein of unknown function (DUF3467)
MLFTGRYESFSPSALPWAAGMTGFSLPVFPPGSEKPYSGSRISVFMSQHEIAVNIPQNLDPVYSNMIQIAYKDDEFTFVFLHQIPGVNQARAKAIVSITPQHAKNLLAVFTKTFADYEAKFGKIETPAGKPQSESVTTMRGYS